MYGNPQGCTQSWDFTWCLLTNFGSQWKQLCYKGVCGADENQEIALKPTQKFTLGSVLHLKIPQQQEIKQQDSSAINVKHQVQRIVLPTVAGSIQQEKMGNYYIHYCTLSKWSVLWGIYRSIYLSIYLCFGGSGGVCFGFLQICPPIDLHLSCLHVWFCFIEKSPLWNNKGDLNLMVMFLWYYSEPWHRTKDVSFGFACLCCFFFLN